MPLALRWRNGEEAVLALADLLELVCVLLLCGLCGLGLGRDDFVGLALDLLFDFEAFVTFETFVVDLCAFVGFGVLDLFLRNDEDFGIDILFVCDTGGGVLVLLWYAFL